MRGLLAGLVALIIGALPTAAQDWRDPTWADGPCYMADYQYAYGYLERRVELGAGRGGADADYLVWVYTADTGPENNWGGWGPPPRGWTSRHDIPHQVNTDGTWTYFGGQYNPWPLGGEPGIPLPQRHDCLDPTYREYDRTLQIST